MSRNCCFEARDGLKLYQCKSVPMSLVYENEYPEAGVMRFELCRNINVRVRLPLIYENECPEYVL